MAASQAYLRSERVGVPSRSVIRSSCWIGDEACNKEMTILFLSFASFKFDKEKLSRNYFFVKKKDQASLNNYRYTLPVVERCSVKNKKVWDVKIIGISASHLQNIFEPVTIRYHFKRKA